MSKKLLFLYPVEEYWVNNFPFRNERSIKKLETTIDLRYRQKGYEIYFATFRNRDVFQLQLQPTDHVIRVETEFFEGFKYPNPEQLLNQLGDTERLVICGFHLPDCVVRMAQGAVDMKFDTLVDVELTENFAYRSSKFYFNPEEYNFANIFVDGMHDIHKYSPPSLYRMKEYEKEFYHLKDFTPTITEEDVEIHEQDQETLFMEFSSPR
ncbi:TPA: hypothetical protein DCP76_02385 [Patescibacteria group bacterium]|nr:hypothetical protein [Patescibacteria group bacterium]